MDNLQRVYKQLGHPLFHANLNRLTSHFRGVLSRAQIKDFLQHRDSYTRMREPKRKFIGNSYFSPEKRYLGQMDLMEFPKVSVKSKSKPQYTYFLLVIDTATRFAFGRKLYSKSSFEVSLALKSIFEEESGSFKNMISDKGTEFYTQNIRNLMEQYGTNHYSPLTSDKCGSVERLVRSLKRVLFSYLRLHPDQVWYDPGIMEQVLNTYNTRVTRPLGISPTEAEKDISRDLIRVKNLEKFEKNRARFMAHSRNSEAVADLVPGTIVRIKTEPRTFGKSFEPKFSQELYIIDRIDQNHAVPLIYIKTYPNREIIYGGFYHAELAAVKTPVVEN